MTCSVSHKLPGVVVDNEWKPWVSYMSLVLTKTLLWGGQCLDLTESTWAVLHRALQAVSLPETSSYCHFLKPGWQVFWTFGSTWDTPAIMRGLQGARHLALVGCAKLMESKQSPLSSELHCPAQAICRQPWERLTLRGSQAPWKLWDSKVRSQWSASPTVSSSATEQLAIGII